VATIPVGREPLGVDVNPLTNTVYLANEFSGTVSVISGRANKVVATIPVRSAPFGIAANP
jgi:YVTN family beta-propeller protein